MGQTGCRYDVRNEFRVGTGFISAPTGNVCLFTENCGKALILEHNGDVYSCDHFMYPEHRLGNIKQTALMALANSPQQTGFRHGEVGLARLLPWLRGSLACHGECPKTAS